MSKKTKISLLGILYALTIFFSFSYPLYFLYKTDGLLRIVGTMFGVMTVAFLVLGTSNKYMADLEEEAENDE